MFLSTRCRSTTRAGSSVATRCSWRALQEPDDKQTKEQECFCQLGVGQLQEPEAMMLLGVVGEHYKSRMTSKQMSKCFCQLGVGQLQEPEAVLLLGAVGEHYKSRMTCVLLMMLQEPEEHYLIDRCKPKLSIL